MCQLVDLKVGFSCNNKCTHCVISDKKHEKDLTLEEIKGIVEEFIEDYGKIQLTLTGGEISIRKDYCEIMEYIRNKKKSGLITFVDMQTNGRMLSNENLLNETIDVVDFFLVALHSNLENIHDDITCSPNSFKQTTLALSKMVEKINPNRIAIQTVINKKNYMSLKNIYKFVYEKFGIKECNITFPHPIGTCFSRNVVPTYKEVQPFINEALDYCLSQDIFPYIEALPFCIFFENERKYLFEFLKKRDLNVVGFGGEKDGKINYKDVFDDGHVKYDSCKKCPYTYMCEGVWKEYKLLYPQDDLFNLLK